MDGPDQTLAYVAFNTHTKKPRFAIPFSRTGRFGYTPQPFANPGSFCGVAWDDPNRSTVGEYHAEQGVWFIRHGANSLLQLTGAVIEQPVTADKLSMVISEAGKEGVRFGRKARRILFGLCDRELTQYDKTISL